jgi:hypothetical protein
MSVGIFKSEWSGVCTDTIGRFLPERWSASRQSVRLTQDLDQLFSNKGFDRSFTGVHFKRCATRRCIAVTDTVNGNDAARSAAGMSAQGKTAINRTLHDTKAIAGSDPRTPGNRAAQCSCCLHLLKQVCREKATGHESIQEYRRLRNRADQQAVVDPGGVVIRGTSKRGLL